MAKEYDGERVATVDYAYLSDLKRALGTTAVAGSLKEAIDSVVEYCEELRARGERAPFSEGDIKLLFDIIEAKRAEWQARGCEHLASKGLPPAFMDFALAIHVWTIQNPSLYKTLNAAMHTAETRTTGNGDLSNHVTVWLPFIKFLDTALSKLESMPGGCFLCAGQTCWRGVTHIFPHPERHQPEVYFQKGRPLCWYEFKSTTEEELVLDRNPEFMGAAPVPRTKFEIKNVHGIRVEHFSKFPQEKEVLVPLLTEFVVESVDKRCTSESNYARPDVVVLRQSRIETAKHRPPRAAAQLTMESFLASMCNNDYEKVEQVKAKILELVDEDDWLPQLVGLAPRDLEDPPAIKLGLAKKVLEAARNHSSYENVPREATELLKIRTRDEHSDKVEQASREHGIDVYQLRLSCTRVEGNGSFPWLREMEFGKPSAGSTRPVKVFPIFGATGSGKSLLLNGLINFIFGVLYTDSFRFRLIDEDRRAGQDSHFGDQAKSQTYYITKYVIHWQPGFNIDYTLVLVDTPGFGDVGGLKRDMEITRQVHAFFGADSGTESWVPHLNGVGFVAKTSDVRLTPVQKYVTDSVLSLFGKNVESGITVCATWCDAGVPKVKQALDVHKVPYCAMLKFNNSAVYSPAGIKGGPKTMLSMFWDIGVDGYGSFLRLLASLPDEPIDMTRQVVQSRSNLEHQLKEMESLTQQGLIKLSALKATYNSVEKHKAAINHNKDFTWEVDEPAWKRDPLPSGVQYVTNCRKCARTCHSDCKVYDKSECCMFHGRDDCSACSANGKSCSPADHHNDDHIFVLFNKKVPRSNAEMREKYEIASNDKNAAQKILDGLADDFVDCQMSLVRTTETIQDILARLAAIAIRPAPTDNVEYIKQLIQQEINEKHSGWDDRVAQLQNCLDQALKVQKIRQDGFDPLAKIRTEATTYLKESRSAKALQTAEEGFWVGVKNGAKSLLQKMF